MTRILLLAAIMLSKFCFGAIINSPSPSYSDVSNAVWSANSGDTVLVPPGTNAWTATLIITNAVTLKGSGTNSTCIILTNAVIDILNLNRSGCRVTGISFVGTTNNTLVQVSGGTSGLSADAITSFRIDHCRFSFGVRSCYVRGWAYGVIDHCTFINCDIAIGITGDSSHSWDRPMELGTTNSCYVEDNAFIFDENHLSAPDQPLYHQDGGRSVTRFNVFDASALQSHDWGWYDSHGNWGGTNPYAPEALTYRGQPILEVYGNSVTLWDTFALTGWRGGSSLIYSNTITQLSGGNSRRIEFTEEEAWSTSFWDILRTNWPAHDQITNSFVWANTYNGVPIAVNTNNAADAPFIQQNRDYWMEAPNATNGAPAGVYASYASLVYPHPLITLQDTLIRPQNVRIQGKMTFSGNAKIN